MNRKELEDFDNAFPDGVYTIPHDTKKRELKVRAMYNFCEQKGVRPSDLSEKEIKQFIV